MKSQENLKKYENNYDIAKLQEIVKSRMSDKRYSHTLGVRDMALSMGKKLGLSQDRLEIIETIAILHDIAKEMDIDEQRDIIVANFDEAEVASIIDNKEIYHGFVGMIIARDELNIRDTVILDGIKYHTIGKAGLSPEGIIVFVADCIEPNRDYPGVDELRRAVDSDVYNGILVVITELDRYLTAQGKCQHPNTRQMYDYLTSKGELWQN